jgi:GTP-binding protein Era
MAAEASALVEFERVFMISATRNDGVEDVARWLAERLPAGPLLYPEDDLTDMPMRLLAAEMTREQVFLQLHDELPYAVAVETEKWEERKDGGARVEQTIYVRRESQRAIVLGKAGARIKEIGRRARTTLSQTLDRPIHLFLHVKVKENWPEDRGQYEAWGLDFNAKE